MSLPSLPLHLFFLPPQTHRPFFLPHTPIVDLHELNHHRHIAADPRLIADLTHFGLSSLFPAFRLCVLGCVCVLGCACVSALCFGLCLCFGFVFQARFLFRAWVSLLFQARFVFRLRFFCFLFLFFFTGFDGHSGVVVVQWFLWVWWCLWLCVGG